jgi:hypothetical protein
MQKQDYFPRFSVGISLAAAKFIFQFYFPAFLR